MSLNGSGIERDAAGNVAIHAPPANARGLAPTPGSAVPTPSRLAQPMARLEMDVPFSLIVRMIRAVQAEFGEEFPFVPNLSLEMMSRLSARDVAELQEMFKPKEQA